METAGIEDSLRHFSNPLKTPNLQKSKLTNYAVVCCYVPLCAVISQIGDIFGDSFFRIFFIPIIQIVDFILKLVVVKFQPLEN